MLPSPTALRDEIERSGLIYGSSLKMGKSYSQTLRRWYENFNTEWDDISGKGFDPRFKNMWNFYLTSCAAGFEYGTTDVAQVTMRRS